MIQYYIQAQPTRACVPWLRPSQPTNQPASHSVSPCTLMHTLEMQGRIATCAYISFSCVISVQDRPVSSAEKIHGYTSYLLPPRPFSISLTNRTPRPNAPVRLRPRNRRPPHPAGKIEHTTPVRRSEPAWSFLVHTRCARRLRLLLLRRRRALSQRISQKEGEELLDQVAQAVWLRVQGRGGDVISLRGASVCRTSLWR
jgi:hypothetical protein